MLLALNWFRRLGQWRSVAAAEAAIITALLVFIRTQGWELQKARLVYLHPETRAVTTAEVAKGPSRRETNIKKSPDGTVETTIVESIGPSLTTVGETKTSKPVPLSIALAAHRSDRWLLGIQLDDGRFRDVDGYTALAGYSFRNRLDFLAGGGADGLKLQVVGRF